MFDSKGKTDITLRVYNFMIFIEKKNLLIERGGALMYNLFMFVCLLIVKVRLISCSKLSVGGNVHVNGRLSLYASPVMNWRLVQSVPHRFPNVSWDRLNPPSRPCKR